MVSPYLSRLARGIEPYVPGEQPATDRLIKLNTNENPYPPSPRVEEALRGRLARLRLYPEIDARTLRECIARREGLSPEEVFAGNGSDEVLSFCFPAFFDPEEPVRFPAVTYSFYRVYAKLFGIPYEEVPMLPGFAVDERELVAGKGGAILPNPNAPTSLELPLGAIERMARAQRDKGRVLVVDEAYVAFGDQPSAATLVHEYDNLLVTRTLSKDHALAGLRVGYALGQRGLIEGLLRIKDSFNSYPVDSLAIAAATAALEDEDYFRMRRDQVVETREFFRDGLLARGFEVLPSRSNFVFARPVFCSGRDLFAALRARGVLVRRWDAPTIEDYLRISIGTREEMEKVLGIIDEIRASSV
ncbi:MAG: pyridoxal phosphate-dependent aminotransferase [Candidatus Spyradocola sp.]|jgi:histidinol-phosphate aminotransferase